MYEQLSASEYLPPRKAKEFLGVSDSTLRRMAKDGRIESMVTPNGYRHYSLSSLRSICQTDSRQKICYCRVSTAKQSQDLLNQVASCQRQFPNHIILTDIGSGLNWKRKGLKTLLDRVFNNQVEEIVVAHKDRLSRFGSELLLYIFNKFNVKLVVLDQGENSDAQELSNDLLSIITVFSARYYGSRKYGHASPKDSIVSEPRTKGSL